MFTVAKAIYRKIQYEYQMVAALAKYPFVKRSVLNRLEHSMPSWPLYASLPAGVASAGPNRVSPVNLMGCLCVPPSCTPSRQLGSLLAVIRAVAGFAFRGQA